MSMTYGGDQITFNDNSTQNTSATGFGFKNRIINGAMMIDQRNAGASVTSAGPIYGIDRWLWYYQTGSGHSMQQSTDAPAGFKNSLKITVGTGGSPSSGQQNIILQHIEGYNTADFSFGTASAVSVTYSFWVKSSLTGTFNVWLHNSGDSREYVSTYTISSANTWEQKTVTIAGDTTGTWLTNNSSGLIVGFSLGCGSDFNATANTWGAGDKKTTSGATNLVGTSGATFYITGVQLEKGSTATSFDYRPYGQELALCERYYQIFNGFVNVADGATGINVTFPFRVPMRTSPSVSCTALQVTRPGVADYTQSSASISIVGGNRVSSLGIQTVAGNFSGLTQGIVYQHNVGIGGNILLSSEL